MVCLERLTMCKRHEHSDVARFFFFFGVCVCASSVMHLSCTVRCT